jgi:hypothetical protein
LVPAFCKYTKLYLLPPDGVNEWRLRVRRDSKTTSWHTEDRLSPFNGFVLGRIFNMTFQGKICGSQTGNYFSFIVFQK